MPERFAYRSHSTAAVPELRFELVLRDSCVGFELVLRVVIVSGSDSVAATSPGSGAPHPGATSARNAPTRVIVRSLLGAEEMIFRFFINRLLERLDRESAGLVRTVVSGVEWQPTSTPPRSCRRLRTAGLLVGLGRMNAQAANADIVRKNNFCCAASIG